MLVSQQLLALLSPGISKSCIEEFLFEGLCTELLYIHWFQQALRETLCWAARAWLQDDLTSVLSERSGAFSSLSLSAFPPSSFPFFLCVVRNKTKSCHAVMPPASQSISLSQNRSVLPRGDRAQTAWSCPDILLVIQSKQILSKQFFFLITWSVQACLDSFAKGQSIRRCSTSRGNCGQSRFTSNKQNDLSGLSGAHLPNNKNRTFSFKLRHSSSVFISNLNCILMSQA